MNTSDIGFFCFVFVPYLRDVLTELAYSDDGHTETICPVCGGDCPGNSCDNE